MLVVTHTGTHTLLWKQQEPERALGLKRYCKACNTHTRNKGMTEKQSKGGSGKTTVTYDQSVSDQLSHTALLTFSH